MSVYHLDAIPNSQKVSAGLRPWMPVVPDVPQEDESEVDVRSRQDGPTDA